MYLRMNQELTKLSTIFLWYTMYIRGRRGGLMVSVLDSEASGPGSSPGWGQDTLLSQCVSPPRCTNGYQQIVGET